MAPKHTVELFESQTIRRVWVEAEEKCYVSVVNVVGALSVSADPGAYRRK